MAYVIRKEGKYLRHVEITTPTGSHSYTNWDARIIYATLFYRDPRGVEGDVERIEAVDARVVVLVQGERNAEESK